MISEEFKRRILSQAAEQAHKIIINNEIELSINQFKIEGTKLSLFSNNLNGINHLNKIEILDNEARIILIRHVNQPVNSDRTINFRIEIEVR